jgi:hypothetical protein
MKQIADPKPEHHYENEMKSAGLCMLMVLAMLLAMILASGEVAIVAPFLLLALAANKTSR